MLTKRILPIAIAALILTSCGNKSGKEVSGTVQTLDIQFATLVGNPGNYIGKDIKVEGKVVHVCPCTGKKMFIVGENPDIMLCVSAGENNPKFPMELQGTKISVEGRLARVVNTEKPVEVTLRMKAATCCDSSAKDGASGPDSTMKSEAVCETETAHAKQPALADLMMIYNKHTLVK